MDHSGRTTHDGPAPIDPPPTGTESAHGHPTSSGATDPTVPGPDAAPRRRRRADLRAVAVVLAVTAAAAAVTAWSAAPPASPEPAGARFVPADGAVSVFDLVNAGGTAVFVQEHQRSTGFDALSSLPPSVGVELLATFDDADLEDAQVWRITSRQLRDGMVGPVRTDVYTVDGTGLHRHAGVGGPYPTIFDPPLLTLPVDPSVDDSWTATGSALFDGALAYDYRATVVDVDADGCVTVAARLALDLTGEPFSTVESQERWCPGSGVVSGSGTFEEAGAVEEVEFSAVADPAATMASVPRPTALPSDPASDPATWSLRDLALVTRDPFFGDLETGGISALAPVVSDDGLVVASFANGDDLVGLRPGPALETDPDQAPRLVEQWRAHPGGEVLTVEVLGDLVVVSTAGRSIVAYDLAGVRRWSARTGDLVLGRAARTVAGAADLVVTQDLGGRITARDAADGRIAWQSATRADSDVGPVVLGDLVVAADRSGDLLALDAASGRQRWRRSYEGIDRIGVVDDLVVVDSADGTIDGVEASGAGRWSVDREVWQARIDRAGGMVALIGIDEVVGLDPTDGSERWQVAVDGAADSWLGGVAVLAGDEVCTHDPADGAVSRCWPFDDAGNGTTVHLVGTEAGIWSVDSSLQARFIGREGEDLG